MRAGPRSQKSVKKMAGQALGVLIPRVIKILAAILPGLPNIYKTGTASCFCE